jgi:hypothetical protein
MTKGGVNVTPVHRGIQVGTSGVLAFVVENYIVLTLLYSKAPDRHDNRGSNKFFEGA